ncbi:MAG: DUF4345 family protein [Planctomycetes bacterium]|nr:DUF4345 family protein [Planctomycetota bacterium]
MLALYLGFNALMYVALGLWCAIAPQQTSAFVGLQPTGAGGQSEYLAVYGGLEFGLGVFFAWAVAVPEYRRAALLMSVLLYFGIVAFRTIAVLRLGFGELGNARAFYALEIVLLLSAVALAFFGPERRV